MNLNFITSLSKEYWEGTGKFCLKTWKNFPGTVTVYIDQQEGDIAWINELPSFFVKKLVRVPNLNLEDRDSTKIRKFWGKACAQISAMRERGKDERIVWIDADVEQTASTLPESIFSFSFMEPIAMLNSGDGEDCWESGIVVFNQTADKIDLVVRKYENMYLNQDNLFSLWKPYDAQALGAVAMERGFLNLCKKKCPNAEALANSHFAPYFKHWINKDNKKLLIEKNK